MWKIKDEKTQARVCEMIAAEKLSELFENCKKYADFEYLYISDGHGRLQRIHKSMFVSDGYEPDTWNKFPEITPPFEGRFLVTMVNTLGRIIVSSSLWTKDIGWHDAVSDKDVLAFREYPKPYLLGR